MRRPSRSLSAAIAALALPLSLAAQRSTTDHGAFVWKQGVDTVVIERFDWRGDTLRGSISQPGRPRMDYVAVFSPGLASVSFEANYFTSSGLGPPTPQQASVTFAPNYFAVDVDGAGPMLQLTIAFRGDSAYSVRFTPAKKAAATTDGALMYITTSMALIEQFARRARAGGATGSIPALNVDAVTSMATVQPIGADSMIVTMFGNEYRLAVDGDGRMRGTAGSLIGASRRQITRVNSAGAARLGNPQKASTDYSAPPGAPYTATEVSLTGPGGIRLGGTLTVPIGATGRSPAVLVITGGSIVDRDGSQTSAGRYRPYRQIADTLGRRGIAVLRLDNRTVGMSGGTLGDVADYADDVRAALAFLRNRPEIDADRLALVGHSAGGVLASLVAANDVRLKGAVLMAAPAPRTEAFKLPALILQGETDQQVPTTHAGIIAEALRGAGNRDVTLQMFPGVNHLLVPDTSGLVSGYSTLASVAVAPQVLGLVADWLVMKLGVRR